ncbi:hypothetical protein AB0P17_33615 [Streptomyces sp. NPDC088124]|uniref:hypothetical protein n=1 Tax=Streptomyces sp. NPDC088124 TaxID=3154654 RepID=UPI003412E903
MVYDLNISAGELRASAGAADTLVTDLRPVLKKAVDDLTAASSSLRHWTAGPRMAETGEGWGGALGALRDNLTEHARGLRLLANGRDIMEQEVLSSFKGW